MLRLKPDIDVVAEIGTGTEALAVAQRTALDIALLDMQMPGRDSLTAAAPSGRCLAAAPSSARLSAGPTTSRAGAAGYFVKDSPLEQLVYLIRYVHAGLRFVGPALAAEALADGASR